MAQSPLHILLVCSQDNRIKLQQVLSQHFVQLHLLHVDNWDELQRRLNSQHWHLVISELMLGDHPATELVRIANAARPMIPLVLIDDSEHAAIADACLDLGVSHIVELTPRQLGHLPHLLRTVLGKAHLHEELAETQRRYEDVLDHTSDLIQCLSLDGYFIYTNQTWREVMGYNEQEVAGLKLADVLHPDSRMCCQGRFETLKKGGDVGEVDFQFVTKTGQPVHLIGNCGTILQDGEVVYTRGIFQNVTARVEAEMALRKSEQRYQSLYENAPDIYTIVNPQGQILSINHTGARLLGYEPGELIGESAARLIHPEDQEMVFAYLQDIFQGKDTIESTIEYRKLRKYGSVMWVQQRVHLEQDEEGKRMFVICRDVTENRLLHEQLIHQASHDALTDLVNRREFELRLNRLLLSDNASETHVLCYLDLDRFKVINDTCGHMAGDDLLKRVATLLKGQMRARDTLARLGGDEFGIILEHYDVERAHKVADKILNKINNFRFYWRSQSFTIGVSIGLVPFHPGQALDDVLTRADSACYRAKEDGRNRVKIGG